MTFDLSLNHRSPLLAKITSVDSASPSLPGPGWRRRRLKTVVLVEEVLLVVEEVLVLLVVVGVWKI